MAERSDLLDVQGKDKIRAMLTAVSKREKDDGWLIPINLGFLPITPFTQKEASRGSFPHAYAEPLIGFVQYKTRRALIEEEKPTPFWRYARAGDAFVASCK
jgi:CRISPR-associated protein Csy2